MAKRTVPKQVGPSPVDLPPALLVNELNIAQSLLRSRADVSHKLFNEIEIESISAIQSLFSGTVFRRCTFHSCNFSRSDFEGARFEHCVFVDTIWDHADIRSSLFSECTFDKNSFSDAYIADNTFSGCAISHTTLDRSTILRNDFNESALIEITNEAATILHSRFQRVQFDKVRFVGCTALYSIFDACEFGEFAINCDSIGLSYGIPRPVLNRIDLGFLGSQEFAPEGIDRAASIIESFRTRHWPLHAAIVTLSYSDIPHVDAWRIVFEVLVGQIELERGVTLDEVEFVLRVAKLSEVQHQLPLAALIYAFDRATPIQARNVSAPEQRALEAFIRELTFLLSRLQEALVDMLVPLLALPPESPIHCEFRFKARPKSDPLEYFRDLSRANHLPMKALPGKAGSWLQPLQTTAEGLGLLLVALTLFEGCIIRITYVRARVGQLFAPTLPAAYLDAAKLPRQEIPTGLLSLLHNLYSGYWAGKVTGPPRDAGLNTEQLESVQVDDSPEDIPATSRSRKRHKR